MSAQQRTAFNVVAVSVASLLQIVNQFLFFKVNASLYGATAETDPLWFALSIPMFLAGVISGSLAYVLVPELVAQFEKTDDERTAWRLASYVGVVTLITCLVSTVLLYLFADQLATWLYEEKVDGQHAQAVRFLRILSVQIVLTSMISWAQATLHSQHKFLWAAAGGVVGTGLQLLLVVLAGSRSIELIAWAINFGSAISLIIHLMPLAPRLGFPTADTPSLVRLLRALWPLLLGAAFLKISPVIDRVWASELDPGSLTHVNFADRIMVALLTIGTSSLALIVFPQLAESYSIGGKSEFAGHFSLCLKRMALLIVPIAIGVSCFSVSIIADLLEGGKFTANDSRIVGILVTLFMGMFIGASAGELLSRGFYVLGDTLTPTVIGVVNLAIGLVLKYVLFQYIGIWGIALGASIYFLSSSSTLAVVLVSRVGYEMLTGVAGYIFQATLASLLACLCCYIVYAFNIGGTWVAAPVGAITYLVGLLLMRNTEARKLVDAARLRVSKVFA